MAPRASLSLYRGEVDLERRILDGPGGTARLSPTEARLLGFLAARAHRSFTAEELLTEVWGYKPGVRSRTVITTVQRLRAKIEVDPARPRHLQTDDAGYRFVPMRDDGPLDDGLVGRDVVLGAVLAAVRQRHPLVSIVGPGGVGKTRLAAAVAEHAAAGQVNDVAWVELEDVERAADVLERVATALSLGGDATAERVRQALAGRAPALLVLDDLDRLDDRARESIAPLVGAPEVTVLVTTRRTLEHPDEERFALGPLTPETSRLLLGRVAEAAGASLSPDVEPALRSLCHALDHLPLALVLAGPWLARLPARSLLDSVEELTSVDGGRHGSLEACLAASWDQLGPAERDDLCRLAVVGPWLPLDLARAVLGNDALVRLEALRTRSLVALDGPRVRILASVRRFARRRTSEAMREAVVDAWYCWVHALGQDFAGLDQVTRAEAERVVEALPLVFAVLDEPTTRPGWMDATVAFTRVQLTLGFDAGIHGRIARLVQGARDRGSRQLLAVALHLRAQVRSRTGSSGPGDGSALADLRTALALADEGTGRARHFAVDLAAMLRLRRDLDGAAAILPRVLEEAREAGDRVVEARCLVELGMLHRGREAFADAIDVLRRAEVVARQAGHRRLEMLAMGARASNERSLDHPVEAERLLRGAIAVAEELSDLNNAAHLKGNLANLCALDERPGEAIRLCREALAHYRAHGHVQNEGFALLGLANAELARGRIEEAEGWIGQARDAFAVGRVPLGEAYAVANAGRIRHHVGDVPRARQRYAEAIELLGDPESTMALRFRAVALLAVIDAGDVGEARELARSLRLADHPQTQPLGELVARGLEVADDPDARRAFAEDVRVLVGTARFDRDYRW